MQGVAGMEPPCEMELAQPQEAVRFEKNKCHIHQSQMLMPGTGDSGVDQAFP